MLRRLSVVLALASAAVAGPASAQVFFQNTRTGALVHYRGAASTAATAAIPSASISPNLLSFSICNDAVQSSSTYLYVGKASDPSTDGLMLAPGACFQCPNCTSALLGAVKVKAQGAANGYSVIMYKQQ